MTDQKPASPELILAREIAARLIEARIEQIKFKLATHDYQLTRIRRVLEVFRRESDRSASVLIFALAEDLILNCFKTHLNQEIKGGWSVVSEGNGVIATASDRISLLELLGWALPSTIADLRLLKSIRNRFAHHADVENFGDAKILGWASSLTPHERISKKVDEMHGIERAKLTPRELFTLRAGSSLLYLVCDLARMPLCRIHDIDPREASLNIFDVLPAEMQEVYLTIVEHVRLAMPFASDQR